MRQPYTKTTKRLNHIRNNIVGDCTKCGLCEHRSNIVFGRGSADAAIMFVRCAVLYPGSEFAAPSLMETALIYRDIVGDHDGARRLLDRASELATVHRQSAVVDRIRQLKSTVGDSNRSEPLSSSSKPE